MTNLSPDPVAWAAREVGLPAGAAPAEVRAALLRDVTRAGFVPPAARRHAWQTLCGSAQSCPPEALLGEESRLRGEVEDFAAGFFAVPIEERRRRWEALAAACAFSPPLAARLAALEAGLGIDLNGGNLGNPRTEQLASHGAGLFVLAPAARAAQRQAVLRTMQGDIAGWEAAARQLQAAVPALAALCPALLADVLSWREQQQRLAKVREARGPARRRPARSASAAAPSRGSTAAGRGLGCGAIFLVGLVIRLCVGLGSYNSHTPDYTPPPQIHVPDFDQMERDRKALEDMQRINRQIEEMNRQHRFEPGQAKPWGGDEDNRFGPGEP